VGKRFYLAGRFEQREMIRQQYDAVRARGRSIAADWTTHAPIKPYDQHEDLCAVCGRGSGQRDGSRRVCAKRPVRNNFPQNPSSPAANRLLFVDVPMVHLRTLGGFRFRDHRVLIWEDYFGTT
jgi:hypothetical protein